MASIGAYVRGECSKIKYTHPHKAAGGYAADNW